MILAEARLAFMLLTRIPVGRMAAAPPLPAAIWAYPLPGAVIGGAIGAVHGLAHLPAPASALLALAAGMLLTGAMHEDGLADFADGFGGGRTRERKLDIMRDSRIGAYGVLALILVIGLRASLLPHGIAVLAGLGAFSRALLPAIMLALPPARQDGLGQSAGDEISLRRVLAGLALGLLMALLCGVPLRALAVGALAAGGVALLAQRQIGGFTGDVLGAAQLLAETAAFCALV